MSVTSMWRCFTDPKPKTRYRILRNEFMDVTLPRWLGPARGRQRHRQAPGLSETAMTRLMLASASPRRLALSGADRHHAGRCHRRRYRRNAAEERNAARAGAASRAGESGSGERRCAACLAADTVVAVGRRVLPKAETEAEARACLTLLSGRGHRVYTGVRSDRASQTRMADNRRPEGRGKNASCRNARDLQGRSPPPRSTPTSPAANGAAKPAVTRCRGSRRATSPTSSAPTPPLSGCRSTRRQTCSTGLSPVSERLETWIDAAIGETREALVRDGAPDRAAHRARQRRGPPRALGRTLLRARARDRSAPPRRVSRSGPTRSARLSAARRRRPRPACKRERVALTRGRRRHRRGHARSGARQEPGR